MTENTTLTDAEAEMIRANLDCAIRNTVNVSIMHLIPQVEKLAGCAKRANALEAEVERQKDAVSRFREHAESAERQRDKAVEALKKYGRHTDDCGEDAEIHGTCDCGYNEALKEVTK